MYYLRFTVNNPFVSFTKLVLFVLDIYNLFKLDNMLFLFTMSWKEKPNPILFLFVIKNNYYTLSCE